MPGPNANTPRWPLHVIMSGDNLFNRVGARIHDITHPHWQQDMEILVGHRRRRLPFITCPSRAAPPMCKSRSPACAKSSLNFGVERRFRSTS
jgi:citrate lyase subunit beta/citryl-CoA lyase